MIKNYYYLVAGILAIIFAFTHSWNGQAVVLPALNVQTISLETKTTFVHIWNIITAENFIFGVSFLIMAFYKDLSQVRFTAWLIAWLMMTRLLVINVVTLVYNPSGFSSVFTDNAAIIIYFAIIILGTRVKDAGVRF
jgi:hypothetical protein